ncbi:MAG: archease [Anaerolineales bacterium]
MAEPPPEKYEEIEHTADWALKVRGHTLPELFVNAARGMMDLAGVTAIEGGGPQQQIDLQANDKESLLVDWLHELLLSMELNEIAFGEIDLSIDDLKLHAMVEAAPIKSLEKPIKAVTYNELKIEGSPQGFEATIVFDV